MTGRLAPFATLAVTAALALSACGDDAPVEPTEPTTVTVTNTAAGSTSSGALEAVRLASQELALICLGA